MKISLFNINPLYGNGYKSIIVYPDAHWGGVITESKSTTGYLFRVGGAAFTWQSKKQSYTALSTAEVDM